MTVPAKTESLPSRPLLSFGTGTAATRVALKIVAGLEFEAWRDVGRRLLTFSEASKWWIGDWLAYGEWSGYGEKYRTAIEKLGLEYDRLRDYAYVANNVPDAIRNPDLTWSHHRIVAKLIPSEQEKWLALAAEEGWTKAEFMDAVQRAEGQARPLPEPPDRPGDPQDDAGRRAETAVQTADLEQVLLTVAVDRLARWKAASARAGLGLHDWTLQVLDDAAGD